MVLVSVLMFPTSTYICSYVRKMYWLEQQMLVG